MFLLFGTSASQTVMVVVAFVCEICGTAASQRVIKRKVRFTLFFIPLFTVSKSFYVECTNCGGTTRLTEQQATHALDWAERSRRPA